MAEQTNQSKFIFTKEGQTLLVSQNGGIKFAILGFIPVEGLAGDINNPDAVCTNGIRARWEDIEKNAANKGISIMEYLGKNNVTFILNGVEYDYVDEKYVRPANSIEYNKAVENYTDYLYGTHYTPSIELASDNGNKYGTYSLTFDKTMLKCDTDKGYNLRHILIIGKQYSEDRNATYNINTLQDASIVGVVEICQGTDGKGIQFLNNQNKFVSFQCQLRFTVVDCDNDDVTDVCIKSVEVADIANKLALVNNGVKTIKGGLTVAGDNSIINTLSDTLSLGEDGAIAMTKTLSVVDATSEMNVDNQFNGEAMIHTINRYDSDTNKGEHFKPNLLMTSINEPDNTTDELTATTIGMGVETSYTAYGDTTNTAYSPKFSIFTYGEQVAADILGYENYSYDSSKDNFLFSQNCGSEPLNKNVGDSPNIFIGSKNSIAVGGSVGKGNIFIGDIKCTISGDSTSGNVIVNSSGAHILNNGKYNNVFNSEDIVIYGGKNVVFNSYKLSVNNDESINNIFGHAKDLAVIGENNTFFNVSGKNATDAVKYTGIFAVNSNLMSNSNTTNSPYSFAIMNSLYNNILAGANYGTIFNSHSNTITGGAFKNYINSLGNEDYGSSWIELLNSNSNQIKWLDKGYICNSNENKIISSDTLTLVNVKKMSNRYDNNAASGIYETYISNSIGNKIDRVKGIININSDYTLYNTVVDAKRSNDYSDYKESNSDIAKKFDRLRFSMINTYGSHLAMDEFFEYSTRYTKIIDDKGVNHSLTQPSFLPVNSNIIGGNHNMFIGGNNVSMIGCTYCKNTPISNQIVAGRFNKPVEAELIYGCGHLKKNQRYTEGNISGASTDFSLINNVRESSDLQNAFEFYAHQGKIVLQNCNDGYDAGTGESEDYKKTISIDPTCIAFKDANGDTKLELKPGMEFGGKEKSWTFIIDWNNNTSNYYKKYTDCPHEDVNIDDLFIMWSGSGGVKLSDKIKNKSDSPDEINIVFECSIKDNIVSKILPLNNKCKLNFYVVNCEDTVMIYVPTADVDEKTIKYYFNDFDDQIIGQAGGSISRVCYQVGEYNTGWLRVGAKSQTDVDLSNYVTHDYLENTAWTGTQAHVYTADYAATATYLTNQGHNSKTVQINASEEQGQNTILYFNNVGEQ